MAVSDQRQVTEQQGPEDERGKARKPCRSYPESGTAPEGPAEQERCAEEEARDRDEAQNAPDSAQG